jgi:hypothetical protein
VLAVPSDPELERLALRREHIEDALHGLLPPSRRLLVLNAALANALEAAELRARHSRGSAAMRHQASENGRESMPL